MARSRKTEVIVVKVTPEDKEAMQKAAERQEMNLSEFIRAACLAYMALRMDKHALGAVLTGAQEMLKEFEQEGKRMFLAKKVKA